MERQQRARRLRGALVGGLLVAASLGVVQAEPGTTEPTLAEAVAAETDTVDWRKVTTARLRVSYPQRLSGSLGLVLAKIPESFDCTTVCDYRGLILQIEPGVAGGQASAGYAVAIGDQRMSETHLTDVYLAFAFKGALLRSWGDSPLNPRVQTLAGVETEFTIARANFSLGLFRNVSDRRPGDRWVVTGGLGWGF